MDHTVALQLLASRQPAFHFALLLLLVPANLSIPREPESLPRWQPGLGVVDGCKFWEWVETHLPGEWIPLPEIPIHFILNCYTTISPKLRSPNGNKNPSHVATIALKPASKVIFGDPRKNQMDGCRSSKYPQQSCGPNWLDLLLIRNYCLCT